MPPWRGRLASDPERRRPDDLPAGRPGPGTARTSSSRRTRSSSCSPRIGSHQHPFKDYDDGVAGRHPDRRGDHGSTRPVPRARRRRPGGDVRERRDPVRAVPDRPREVAAYYQAADLYLHAANAEPCPRRSSRPCRRACPWSPPPSAGSRRRSAASPERRGRGLVPPNDRAQATGVLVDRGDAHGMAAAATAILADTRCEPPCPPTRRATRRNVSTSNDSSTRRSSGIARSSRTGRQRREPSGGSPVALATVQQGSASRTLLSDLRRPDRRHL